jgi:hypothetical protein
MAWFGNAECIGEIINFLSENLKERRLFGRSRYRGEDNFETNKYMGYEGVSRSQWPRGLRHDMSPSAQTLESWVRILLKAWMFVCVYSVFVLSCVGSDLASG